MWRQAMTPEQTRAETEFLQNVLQAGESSRILDVPCGNGRHSIDLARKGHRVTGVDLSEEFMAEARTTSQSLPATWIVSDMRQLPWSEEFDAAFCFGNSFGYLDPNAARDFLAAVARTLKPGSRFAIETGMAAESIFPSVEKKRWYKVGDIYMLSENQYHPREGRLDIQYTFIRDGQADRKRNLPHARRRRFAAYRTLRLHPRRNVRGGLAQTDHYFRETAGDSVIPIA
jgi:SAM-dependent methyltransferase